MYVCVRSAKVKSVSYLRGDECGQLEPCAVCDKPVVDRAFELSKSHRAESKARCKSHRMGWRAIEFERSVRCATNFEENLGQKKRLEDGPRYRGVYDRRRELCVASPRTVAGKLERETSDDDNERASRKNRRRRLPPSRCAARTESGGSRYARPHRKLVWGGGALTVGGEAPRAQPKLNRREVIVSTRTLPLPPPASSAVLVIIPNPRKPARQVFFNRPSSRLSTAALSEQCCQPTTGEEGASGVSTNARGGKEKTRRFPRTEKIRITPP